MSRPGTRAVLSVLLYTERFRTIHTKRFGIVDRPADDLQHKKRTGRSEEISDLAEGAVVVKIQALDSDEDADETGYVTRRYHRDLVVERA